MGYRTYYVYTRANRFASKYDVFESGCLSFVHGIVDKYKSYMPEIWVYDGHNMIYKYDSKYNIEVSKEEYSATL